jgi:hypothetical protein
LLLGLYFEGNGIHWDKNKQRKTSQKNIAPNIIRGNATSFYVLY